MIEQAELAPSWKKKLTTDLNSEWMSQLDAFLNSERKKGKIIYPAAGEIFTALSMTPFDKVRVVIVGQDPYHGENQAHGLSFSVKNGVRPPPSLKNIYKELKSDIGVEIPTHGNLQRWAEQGVLLLNAVLTVEASKPASHQGKGWEKFTDAIVDHLNREREGIVFVLWGSYAQKKGIAIDRKRHFVIESAHPSPLSAHRGFLGSKPFSKINDYLKSHHGQVIDWAL